MHCVGKMFNLCNANANATYQGTLTWPYSQSVSQPAGQSARQAVSWSHPMAGGRQLIALHY